MSKTDASPAGILGWQEHVAEQRQQSIFWHFIWKQCGSPSKGVVAELRRRTRSQYHQAAKKAKNNIEIAKTTKAANALLEKHTKISWSEIRKLKVQSHIPSRTSSAQKIKNYGQCVVIRWACVRIR